ncbi:unnamed protein product [Gongylonema pulchrum]|uniref:Uncharacterized protein n=1 Tax=Gongylonema pulchrum TaxID=637853 RepID=A0A3P7PCG5_9BILA|nr:unnamed protein product [Gongylonema pulchrum]
MYLLLEKEPRDCACFAHRIIGMINVLNIRYLKNEWPERVSYDCLVQKLADEKRIIPTKSAMFVLETQSVNEASPTTITSANEVSDNKNTILLLCKEVQIVDPKIGKEATAVVFLGVGSQLSFTTDDLSKQLGLKEGRKEILKKTRIAEEQVKEYSTAVVIMHLIE